MSLTLFVTFFGGTFAIFFGCGCYLVVECNVFQIMCALWSQCVPRCYFHRFRLCLCMSDVFSSFRRLRAESQMFALLKLFLCVILHTMWSGKSMQLLCILPFDILCLCAIKMMFVKIILIVCMLIGIVIWEKADSASSLNGVQSAFL